MSDRIEDGGPAFPQANDDYVDHPVHGRILLSHLDRAPDPGMSLRDWFAGQALAGIMAKSYRGEAGDTVYAYHIDDAMLTARNAYKIADALLAARKGGQS